MRKFAVLLTTAAAISFAGPSIARAASAGVVLHDFTKSEGKFPAGTLLLDSSGALYGTAELGGQYNDGTVFKLTPPAAGTTRWSATTLHSFSGTAQPTADGMIPVTGVIMDASGNLFGVTQNGGQTGYGTVFELSPPAAGQTAWTETILDDFATSACTQPTAGLIMDAAGALYGTTSHGGPGGGGCAFRLTPPPSGQAGWTETVLHYFFQVQSDGRFVYSGLVADAAGNLYGNAAQGGTLGFGMVYELSPPAAGQSLWVETTLYDFTGYSPGDGQPASTMIFDGAGALYGTSEIGGGGSNDGTVFKLTLPSRGQTGWSHAALFSFDGADGQGSSSGLYRQASGALLGTSPYGGSNSQGLVYKLTPPAAGQSAWTQTILYAFTGGGGGGQPSSTLIADSAGNLYGTVGNGGAACSCGSVDALLH